MPTSKSNTMVLVRTSDLQPSGNRQEVRAGEMVPLGMIDIPVDPDPDLVDFVSGVLTKSIGLIESGRQKHYYSEGISISYA